MRDYLDQSNAELAAGVVRATDEAAMFMHEAVQVGLAEPVPVDMFTKVKEKLQVAQRSVTELERRAHAAAAEKNAKDAAGG